MGGESAVTAIEDVEASYADGLDFGEVIGLSPEARGEEVCERTLDDRWE